MTAVTQIEAAIFMWRVAGRPACAIVNAVAAVQRMFLQAHRVLLIYIPLVVLIPDVLLQRILGVNPVNLLNQIQGKHRELGPIRKTPYPLDQGSSLGGGTVSV